MELVQIAKIYERLGTFSLEMPRDPASLGPDFLRETISLCRNYLNETSHYLQDVLVEESYLAMRLDAEEAQFQIRSSELLATDERVTLRPNITDRQAMIDTLLKDEKRRIILLQGEIRSLSHVKAVIRHRKTELDNTMSAIRLQRSLLKDQLRTGAFYGDESERSRGRALDPIDELETVDLEALLASSEADLEQERGAQPSSESPPSHAIVKGSDPVDSLSEGDLEALFDGPLEAAESEPVEKHPSEPEDTRERDLNLALARFLEEPDEDVASIIANL